MVLLTVGMSAISLNNIHAQFLNIFLCTPLNASFTGSVAYTFNSMSAHNRCFVIASDGRTSLIYSHIISAKVGLVPNSLFHNFPSRHEKRRCAVAWEKIWKLLCHFYNAPVPSCRPVARFLLSAIHGRVRGTTVSIAALLRT